MPLSVVLAKLAGTELSKLWAFYRAVGGPGGRAFWLTLRAEDLFPVPAFPGAVLPGGSVIVPSATLFPSVHIYLDDGEEYTFLETRFAQPFSTRALNQRDTATTGQQPFYAVAMSFGIELPDWEA